MRVRNKQALKSPQLLQLTIGKQHSFPNPQFLREQDDQRSLRNRYLPIILMTHAVVMDG
jgi:hypothetical protein